MSQSSFINASQLTELVVCSHNEVGPGVTSGVSVLGEVGVSATWLSPSPPPHAEVKRSRNINWANKRILYLYCGSGKRKKAGVNRPHIFLSRSYYCEQLAKGRRLIHSWISSTPSPWVKLRPISGMRSPGSLVSILK